MVYALQMRQSMVVLPIASLVNTFFEVLLSDIFCQNSKTIIQNWIYRIDTLIRVYSQDCYANTIPCKKYINTE